MGLPLAINDVDSGMVIVLIVLITIPIGAIAFAASGPALRALGKGRFAIEQELPRRTTGPPPPINRREQEAEVRQMVEAKSYRRQARGEEPLDVDAEVKRLLHDEGDSGGGASGLGRDKELREEVRQLVIARNERRMRRGQPPLDVEEEIERQLRDLENLGQ